MSFANHLRVRRLGEFTVGTDLYRSDSLALVQLLILYHLMEGRIEQTTGGPGGASSHVARVAMTQRYFYSSFAFYGGYANSADGVPRRRPARFGHRRGGGARRHPAVGVGGSGRARA